MRTALVHDFLYTMRGAERVLDVLCELYPDADLYSLIYRKGSLNPRIENRRVFASPLRFFPGNHRYWLPLYPWAISRFDFEGYDLVVSSSYAVAKGARVPEGTPHICYCHTPMRYVWDMYGEYFHPSRRWKPVRAMMDLMARRLRAWDVRTAAGVDAFVANSTTVAERIRRIYGRESTVIHPPADAEFFTPSAAPREDWYLCASAFAPYKRADLAMEAFRKSGRKLKVVGAGQDEARIRSLAGGSVEVLGWLSDEALRDLYRRGRALVFAGEEDFGIVPVEAQLCGMPVVAFGRGGLRDSVVEGETGFFFGERTPESLNDAVARFEASAIRPETCRRNAERFARPRFRDALRDFIDRTVEEVRAGRSPRKRASSGT
ncbi:MAG TPA: glycosyltransferase [Planctomycetota bacterium]|nr:glycosyltransferase [Planctomycetota bacterium]